MIYMLKVSIVCCFTCCLLLTLSSVIQPVYVKDDFFDSLSCDALNSGSHNGRPRFSEQVRRDTEVLFLFCPPNFPAYNLTRISSVKCLSHLNW